MTFHGFLCEVENPKELVELSKKVRDSGYTNFDTYSPFPIHGIDKAMGIPASGKLDELLSKASAFFREFSSFNVMKALRCLFSSISLYTS